MTPTDSALNRIRRASFAMTVQGRATEVVDTGQYPDVLDRSATRSLVDTGPCWHGRRLLCHAVVDGDGLDITTVVIAPRWQPTHHWELDYAERLWVPFDSISNIWFRCTHTVIADRHGRTWTVPADRSITAALTLLS